MDPPSFKSDILETKDLEIGMVLDGVVRNVTDFGAFVDIGLHNDGLVHKSQLADRYITNPSDVVSVGMQVKVRVLDIDLEREKVSLSMKTLNDIPVTAKTQPTVKRTTDTGSQESGIKSNISWG
ncbi:MAG: S1 RNA-binding domain-containing protein [bacterium]